MFHKEGAKIILIATVIVAAWILLADEFISITWLRMSVQTIGLIFLILILQFFRNPKRNTQIDDNHITAPVDGKVVVHIVHDGNDASQEIQDQMIQDNLVVKGKKVDYILTDNEMLVNGIAQDASVHQKYKEKYIKRPDIEYRINR